VRLSRAQEEIKMDHVVDDRTSKKEELREHIHMMRIPCCRKGGSFSLQFFSFVLGFFLPWVGVVSNVYVQLNRDD